MRPRLVVDQERILRYAGPGPRYTSYPTAPVWTEAVGPVEARAALDRASARPADPLAIYVHIPFCRRLCLYCGCTVEITRRADRVTRYLDALEQEVGMVSRALGERRRVVQIHWGGGTPTHLTPEELRRVYGALAAGFDIAPEAEIGIEVHPHVTTSEQLATLLDLGFNRISMGVQDTDPEVQRIVHRDQTLDETARLVEAARAGGVDGVNIDLMYGLPGQTEATFARTLDDVAALRPDRMAVYGYAHVPWLKPAQRALEAHDLPDAVQRARLFATAAERLGDEGYELIGFDHFALRSDALARGLEDGSLHRNFMGYTTLHAPDMIAFGASAIADVGGAFLQNLRTSKEYEAAIANGELPVHRGHVRTDEDDLRRAAIQELLCRGVLDLDALEAATGRTDLRGHFAPEWERLERHASEGLCVLAPGRIEVTPEGRLFQRHLAMEFDAYLERDKPREGRFSQTV